MSMHVSVRLMIMIAYLNSGSDEGQTLGSLLLPSFKINPCFKDEDGISKKYAFKVSDPTLIMAHYHSHG